MQLPAGFQRCILTRRISEVHPHISEAHPARVRETKAYEMCVHMRKALEPEQCGQRRVH